MSPFFPLALVALVVATAPSAAQSNALTKERLNAVAQLDCSFSLLIKGAWPDHQVNATITHASLSFRFDDVHAEDGTARVVDRFGSVDIIVRRVGDTLHFLQVFSDGPLHTTTVFNHRSADGRLLAVHTRHRYTDVEVPGFTSRPEHYYGSCAAKQ